METKNCSPLSSSQNEPFRFDESTSIINHQDSFDLLNSDRLSYSPKMSLTTALRSVNKSFKSTPEFSDRFIPIREPQNWNLRFNMLQDASNSHSKQRSKESNSNSPGISSEMLKNGLAYQCLLKNELLGAEIEDINEFKQIEERKALTPLLNRNVFRFRTKDIRSEPTSPYSLSPISLKSQKMLRSPRKTTRKISKMPFKVLDAPELQDDFYLNLVDWSNTNILSVGLGGCVYLWSACTSQVTRLCDFTSEGNPVTSVSWSERGNLISVGTQRGFVQVWDVAALKCLKQFDGHSGRVGCLAWNGDTVCSGSRDRYIFQRDIRSWSTHPERKLASHRQEVCGLKWSPDNQLLASGGNDNRIHIWNQTSTQPAQTYTEHLAAVKAIAWSPHHHGLLASGGGTADRCIRFWNTLTGQPMQCVDTGSQVCNLAWSKHAPELVSTHGYSQNQILVWKYPSLVQVAKLTGHSFRVLYLAISPDGESIVTGAGDETLRFWNVFSKARSQKETKSALDLFSTIR
ncbi:Protein FIZZY-RELATED 2 [Sarcoptes scabiei]|uniref:Fizzy-related protein homolog n=2 Tax=Sarcoptes scabiei TaxID=52283 RepID=A0A834R6F4_SARSC|nr:Protein FIZZY-RELATED 2 [Sarcoptes scabiei]